MSKHKKKRKNVAIKVKEPTGWNKPLTRKQKILFVAISIISIILIVLVSAFLLGERVNNTQGFNSTDEMITAYFTKINNADTSSIYTLFYNKTQSYNKDVSDYVEHVKAMNEANTEFNLDSINIETQDYENDMQTLENEIRLEPITAAKICYVMIDKSEFDTELAYTYESTIYYKFICYNVLGKWYMWSNTELDSILNKIVTSDNTAMSITDLLFENDLMSIGNNHTGYMAIPTDWRANESMYIDGIKSMVVYTNPDSTAQIALAAYENTDVNTFATNLYISTENDDQTERSLLMINDKCGEYNAVRISYNDSKTYTFVWLFDNPLHDDYVHSITLTCSSDQTLLKHYVAGFSF